MTISQSAFGYSKGPAGELKTNPSLYIRTHIFQSKQCKWKPLEVYRKTPKGDLEFILRGVCGRCLSFKDNLPSALSFLELLGLPKGDL